MHAVKTAVKKLKTTILKSMWQKCSYTEMEDNG